MNAMTKPRLVYLSDTTLRDGEQMPGASLDPSAKVTIAKLLGEAGVSSIDAGFPACGASEVEAVRRVADASPGPVVSALCRTLRDDIDRAWDSLADCPRDKRSVSLFIGTSPLHREYKLRMKVAQLRSTIRESVEYARRKFDFVAFSPEDASRTEPDVLCECYQEAIDAGALVIGFPDTVGILTPGLVQEQLRRIQDGVSNVNKAAIAVHFHNDLGLATANTLTALAMGVPIAQCTVNGIGERAGNTALEEVVMAIALNGPALGMRTAIATEKLWGLSQTVSELTGVPVAPNKAVVGRNILATEAGIHQDGLLKHPDTYLPFRPERVGAPGTRLVLGKHSGRAAFSERLERMGLKLSGADLTQVVEIAKAAPRDAWRDEEALLASAVAAVRTRERN